MRVKSPARPQVLVGLALILSLIHLPLLPAPAEAGNRHAVHQHRGRSHHALHEHRGWSHHWRHERRPMHHRAGWRMSRAERRARWAQFRQSLCDALASQASEAGEASHTDHGPWSRKHGHHFLALLLGCEAPEPEPTFPQAPPPLATLVDAAGAPFAQLGRVDTDDTVIEVPASSPVADAVVILGPPTRRDAEPGVPQLQAVEEDRFRVRLREWMYLDGVHAKEAVSYLILSPGRHELADGSVWEVGSLEVAAADSFVAHSFTAPFADAPALFLTVQTLNEDSPVAVRAQGVTESGFETSFKEEDGADGVHAAERLGYLAVWSPAGSGELTTTESALPYLTSEVVADHRPVPVLSGSLWMEEEASGDAETEHNDETVAFLALGTERFAQAVTVMGTDPVAVRRSAPEPDAEIEWGTFAAIDDLPHTIPLARRYEDPVVVVGPASGNGDDPGVLRASNVRADAFDLRFQEWAYLDGTHFEERAFYMVAERGVHAVGGLMLEAGSTETSILLGDGMQDVAFTVAFTEAPAVFASPSTENDPQPITVRVSDRTPLGFKLAMQVEEGSAGGHGAERTDWIAIQKGEGTTADGRRVRVFDAAVSNAVAMIPLGEGLRGRLPTVLAKIVSVVGTDPVDLRFEELTADTIGLMADEESSGDLETDHAVEDVSIFVAE